MHILVIAPMEQERDNFLEALKRKREELGTLRNHYHVLQCGVGKATSAMRTEEWFHYYEDVPLDMIALIGYAAGGRDHCQGDFVIPSIAVFHDADVPPVPLFEPLRRRYSLRGTEPCTVATGDCFVGRMKARRLERAYGRRTIFDMESAAVAMVAEKERLPLLVMKWISDIPGSFNNYQSFEEFVSTHTDFQRFVEVLEQF